MRTVKKGYRKKEKKINEFLIFDYVIQINVYFYMTTFSFFHFFILWVRKIEDGLEKHECI